MDEKKTWLKFRSNSEHILDIVNVITLPVLNNAH